MAFRCGQLLFQLAPLENEDEDEAERRRVQPDGANRQLLPFEHIGLVSPERIPSKLLEPAARW